MKPSSIRSRRRHVDRPGRGIEIEISSLDILGDLVRIPFEGFLDGRR